MELLDIVMLLGITYVSWRAGKSVGQTIARVNYATHQEHEQVKEKILIEKIDSVYFAYKQNRFFSQNEDLCALILDAMGKNQGATLVAENTTVERDIRALLDAVRQESDTDQPTTPTH